MPIEIFIVRHGETDLNQPGEERFRAWSNPDLNENGKKHAQKVGKILADYHIKTIFCSDLFRTYHTAWIISRAAGGTVVPTRKLRSWDLGFLTGEKVNAETIKKFDFYRLHPDIPIPQGESYHTFALRFAPALEKCMQYAIKHPEEKLVLVTHSNPLALTMAFVKGQPLNQLDYEDESFPGAILKLTLGRNKKWKLAMHEQQPNGKKDESE